MRSLLQVESPTQFKLNQTTGLFEVKGLGDDELDEDLFSDGEDQRLIYSHFSPSS
jgi:hypothetical protein